MSALIIFTGLIIWRAYLASAQAFFVFHQRTHALLFLSNTDITGWKIAYGLAGILFNREYEPPIMHKATRIDSMLADQFIGKYKLSDPVLYCKEIELTRKEDRLYLRQTDIDIPDFPVEFEFNPSSVNTFFNKDWLMELKFVIDPRGGINQAFIIECGVKIEMKKF